VSQVRQAAAQAGWEGHKRGFAASWSLTGRWRGLYTSAPLHLRRRPWSEHETNFSTQPKPPEEKTWFPCADGYPNGALGVGAPPGERALETDGFRRVMSGRAPAPEGRRRLCPLDSLRRRADFQRVYEKENRCSGKAVLVHVFFRSDDLPARLGLTVSRRCGKACVRNRIRRRLREIVRQERDQLCGGWDIVLTARRAAAESSFSELRRQVLRCLARQGVLHSDGEPT